MRSSLWHLLAGQQVRRLTMELKSWLRLCAILGVVTGISAAPDRKKECAGEIVSTSVLPLLQSISAEIQQVRDIKKSLEEILPTLANIPSALNNISSEIQLIKKPRAPKPEKTPSGKQDAPKPSNDHSEKVAIQEDCSSGPNEAEFATSPHYANTKLVSSASDDLITIKLSKKSTTKECASAQCSKACVGIQSCHAFNIYESGASYVCELVPDNLCRNNTKLAFVNWPGGNVWEKKASAESPACVDAKSSADGKISCEVLRPGCSGTWPDCHSCLQNCGECSNHHSYFFSDGECTYWPDADASYSTPIFGRCSSMFTYLATRKVNVTTGEVTQDFVMPFKDMHRLAKQHSDKKLQFWFKTTASGDWFWYEYVDWFIGEDGTLSNLKLDENSRKAEGDIFNLNGGSLKPTPFITVDDDRYGCGSFWLLDSKNATYCPGGKFGMFGSVQLSGNKVLSTGISSPQSTRDGKTLVAASILLSH